MKHPDPRIEALLQKLASPALNAIDLSLERIRALMRMLGDPQERLAPVIHIAGTNGKGSLAAYLTAIFAAADYRVHRYISPHLVTFNERIMLAGRDITDAQLLPLLKRVSDASARQPVTFFEATTALAYLAFSETPADVVLLETGLGGRLDATNILRAPALTAVTPISIDHAEYLGNSLELIAAEKAAIIKRRVPCVLGPQCEEAQAVLEEVARENEAPLYRHGREWNVRRQEDELYYRSSRFDGLFPLPGLAGEHQIANAGTAIACVEQMPGFSISRAHIAEGLRRVQWPARLQHLFGGTLTELLPKSAELWLDGGHNPGAGYILAAWMRERFKPVHVICGMVQKKDTKAFLAPMAGYLASLTLIEIPDEPMSQKPQTLYNFATEAGVNACRMSLGTDVKSAIKSIVNAEKKESFIILICGSLYLAGHILWLNSQNLKNAAF